MSTFTFIMHSLLVYIIIGNFGLWDNFVRSQLKAWKAYYNYILSAKKNSRPIHVVR